MSFFINSLFQEVAVYNGDTELVRDLQQQINDLDEKSKKSVRKNLAKLKIFFPIFAGNSAQQKPERRHRNQPAQP